MINVHATLDKIPLPVKKDWDLCTESAVIDLKCPINPGTMILSAQPTVISLAPPVSCVLSSIE